MKQHSHIAMHCESTKSTPNLLYFNADVPQRCRLTAVLWNMHLGGYGPGSFQLSTPMVGAGIRKEASQMSRSSLFHTCWRNLLHRMLIKCTVKGPRVKVPLATTRNVSRQPSRSAGTKAISYVLPHSMVISTLKYVHMSICYSVSSHFLPVVWETRRVQSAICNSYYFFS